MNSKETKIICLDIGGSSVKSGVIKFNSNTPIGKLTNILTTELDEKTFSCVKSAVKKSIDHQLKIHSNDITSIGISTSGSVDKDEIVISAGHFKGYENINWAEILKTEYSFIEQVAVANDGRASALGEYSQNIRSEATSHVHLVVGTGVGGGIIYNNELLLGESGQAGYIGHQKIFSSKTSICSCGKQGCVEALASAPAIVYQYLNQTKSSENREVSFEIVINSAKQGEIAALEALKRSGYYLGVGIGNALNILNSSIVTVGGGVVLAAKSVENAIGENIYFNAIDDGFKFASHRRVYASAKILPAKLGNDSGMVGAAVLVSRKIV